MNFQVLQQQAEQMNKYLEELEQKRQEFEQTKESLKEFEKTPVETQTMIPVASGIFAQGKITENKELIVNVGANILVKKNIPQTVDLIDEQVKEIEQAQTKITQDIQKINLEINSLFKELQDLS